jgi:hypothetical protein
LLGKKCGGSLLRPSSEPLVAQSPAMSQGMHRGDAVTGDANVDSIATNCGGSPSPDSGDDKRPRGPNFFLLDPEFKVGVFES